MLKIQNLKKAYPGFELNVSLEIPSGQVIGLVGPNGSGKSTTFKSILQLIRPDHGSIRLFGEETGPDGGKPLRIGQKERLGVVLSDSGFSGQLTGSDIGRILKNLYPAFEEKHFLEICRDLNLEMGKAIREMSTGNKARLKLAAALSHSPDLLILDEPTAGLDVVGRNRLLDLLRAYMEEKDDRSILISSHISTDLEGFCDHLYLIHEGKIVLEEDTDVLLSDYAVLKVDEETYQKMDRRYILRTRKEAYGYACLTGQKAFYRENVPGIVIENGSIDDLILMMSDGGEKK